ncbi:hypothetical protein D3C85_1153780 [compost metagenome]
MQGGASAGVEPCKAAAQPANLQSATPQVFSIDIGDFQLATGGRFHRFCDVQHTVVVDIDAWNRITAFGVRRLFLDRDRLPHSVELHHPVTLGILDVIGENACAIDKTAYGAREIIAAGEDIVAEHQDDAIRADKIRRNQKGLRDSFRTRLLAVFNLYSPLRSVSQQVLVPGQILRGRDQAELLYARCDQYRQGVVNHRFVENRL